MDKIDYTCSCLIGEVSAKMMNHIYNNNVYREIKEQTNGKHGSLSDIMIKHLIVHNILDYTVKRDYVILSIQYNIPIKYESQNDMKLLTWWEEQERSIDECVQNGGVSVNMNHFDIIIPITFSFDEITQLYISKYGVNDIDTQFSILEKEYLETAKQIEESL